MALKCEGWCYPFKGKVKILAVKTPSFQSKLSYGPENLREHASQWYFSISFKKNYRDPSWGSGSEISEIHGFGASRKFLIQEIGKVKTEMIHELVINDFYVWKRSREQYHIFWDLLRGDWSTDGDDFHGAPTSKNIWSGFRYTIKVFWETLKNHYKKSHIPYPM